MEMMRGLSESEVIARRERGQGNNVKLQTSRTYADILRQNVFTFINIILFTIGTLLVIIGRVQDAVTSVGLIFLNIVIGVYQEARAKRQLDQIALLTRPKATVIRDGVERHVDPSELVIGDYIVARPGDQIVVDGTVIDGKMDVDESLLTGESDLIPKQAGDPVMSGSFCVSGSATYEATRVGAESYANKLTSSARMFKIEKTPLQRDIDFTLRLLMSLAVFIGFLLLFAAIISQTPVIRGVQMAAVVAGLIPNGLFLMVIIAYAMGALRIAGRGALIQQSNSVESLSNVTVLCMDKTGTLTANQIDFYDVHPIGIDADQLKQQLGDFVATATVGNRTSDALATALAGSARTLVDEVPFSSARKWSALSLDDDTMRGVYVLGALEMIADRLGRGADEVRPVVQAWSDNGLRVLVFAHNASESKLHDSQGQPRLPDTLTPLGVVAFTDQLRENVQQTIAEFVTAGVTLKIISGDNPQTVAALARQAGFQGMLNVVSGTELDDMTDAELDSIIEETTVFGRITPQQKERIVDALRRRGHYVAMMGDGVNDVLSLKKANLGIAMNSGSAAARGVADIVLLNDSFAALPPAFLEGQRIVNGMRDILRLFLTRALIVALLILSLAVVGVGFPFIPTHVSLLTLFTVGLPTLALATWARPAQSRVGLFRSVINFVFPAALSVFVFGMGLYVSYYIVVAQGALEVEVTPEDIAEFQTYAKITYSIETQEQYALELAGAYARTVLTTFTIFTGLILVIFVEPPIPFFTGGDDLSPDKRPTYLAGGLLIAFLCVVSIAPVRNFFELVPLPLQDYAIIALATLIWMLTLRQAFKGRWFQRFFQITD